MFGIKFLNSLQITTNYYKLVRKPQKVINRIRFVCYHNGTYPNIWMELICKRSTLIKSHILEVCAIALKAVSIIQNSLIPFRLSKLLNLINTERVWQSFKILDSLQTLFESWLGIPERMIWTITTKFYNSQQYSKITNLS